MDINIILKTFVAFIVMCMIIAIIMFDKTEK